MKSLHLAAGLDPGPERLAERRALGYVRVRAERQLESETRAIEDACRRLGLDLRGLVHDFESRSGDDQDRPGLEHVLERIGAGEAGCLVVADLDCLAGSTAALGAIVAWFDHESGRLIALDPGLDTATPAGRLGARALVAASRLEREKLGTATRRGLAAAATDHPDLTERIAALREEGLTLQAIADRLNEEGVPTLRGGAEWRPSSVQAAAGYRRPARALGPRFTRRSHS